jgi:hypothetical protein
VRKSAFGLKLTCVVVVATNASHSALLPNCAIGDNQDSCCRHTPEVLTMGILQLRCGSDLLAERVQTILHGELPPSRWSVDHEGITTPFILHKLPLRACRCPIHQAGQSSVGYGGVVCSARRRLAHHLPDIALARMRVGGDCSRGQRVGDRCPQPQPAAAQAWKLFVAVVNGLGSNLKNKYTRRSTTH